jgi:hypothetical protein
MMRLLGNSELLVFLFKVVGSLAGLGAVARYWFVVGRNEGRHLGKALTIQVHLETADTQAACEQVNGQLDRVVTALEAARRRVDEAS